MRTTVRLSRWGERIRQEAMRDAPVTDLESSGHSPFEEQLDAERKEALSNRRIEQIQDRGHRGKHVATVAAKKHNVRHERRLLRVERQQCLPVLDVVMEQASQFPRPRSLLLFGGVAAVASLGDAVLIRSAFLILKDTSNWLAIALTVVVAVVLGFLAAVAGPKIGTEFRDRAGRTALAVGMVAIAAIAVIRQAALPRLLINNVPVLAVGIALAVLHAVMFIAAMYAIREMSEDAPAREAWRQVTQVEREIAALDRRIEKLQRTEDKLRVKLAQLRIEEEYAAERYVQERRSLHWFFAAGKVEYRRSLSHAKHRPVRSWFASKPVYAAGRVDRRWPRDDRRARVRTEDRE